MKRFEAPLLTVGRQPIKPAPARIDWRMKNLHPRKEI